MPSTTAIKGFGNLAMSLQADRRTALSIASKPLLHFLDVGSGRKQRVAAGDHYAAHVGVECRIAAGRSQGCNQFIAQRISLGRSIERELTNVGMRSCLQN
jgi:hypothetical protein